GGSTTARAIAAGAAVADDIAVRPAPRRATAAGAAHARARGAVIARGATSSARRVRASAARTAGNGASAGRSATRPCCAAGSSRRNVDLRARGNVDVVADDELSAIAADGSQNVARQQIEIAVDSEVGNAANRACVRNRDTIDRVASQTVDGASRG